MNFANDLFRDNFFMGFCGDTKTGKTVTMFEIAEYWKKVKPKHYTVYGYDHHGNKGHIIDVKIDISDENWDEGLPKFRNGLLILDEKRLLHSEDKLRKNWGKFLGDFQNRNVDVMYAVHNPKLILEKFTYFTSHYYVFKTNSREGGFKDKIPDYRLAYAASMLVNKYVQINGKGTYPNFPFVEVNRLKLEVNAYNMKNEKSTVKELTV